MIWLLYKASGEIVGAAASEDWAEMAAGATLGVIKHNEDIDIRHYTVVDGRVEKKPEVAIAAEEAYRIYEEMARQVRFKRSRLLVKSDWTQAADAPVDAAVWAAYRQALRDIPQQPGFPHNVEWPEVPA